MPIHSNKRTLLSACSLLILSGCVTPKEPKNSNISAEALAPNVWQRAQNSDTILEDWLSNFNDPRLEELIAEAMNNNFGLEAANYQVNASMAALRISKSLRMPSVDLSLNSGRQQTRSSVSDFQAVRFNSNSLNFGARWEIDVWNRLGKQSQASQAQYEATLLDYQGFQLSLAGQVARSWYNAVLAKAQLELSIDTTKALVTNLEVLEKRYERGLVTSFDLRLARSQTATSKSLEPQRRNTLNAAIRQLETLLGRYPNGTLDLQITIPDVPPKVPAGLPAELLTRRPDIAAAAARLRASVALDSATQMNWLPSIALTASGGTTSDQLSDLLDSNFDVWSIFGSLSAPLFQSGRLKGERQQSEALLNAQTSQYKNTVLSAFSEVETTLANEVNFLSLLSELEIAAEESSKAEKQSWKLYERGLIDITSLLDAQQRSFNARSQYLSARNSQVQNRISLHLSLGGGFQLPTL